LVCVQGGLDYGGRSVNPSPRTSPVTVAAQEPRLSPGTLVVFSLFAGIF
jgi:hypothetical protein